MNLEEVKKILATSSQDEWVVDDESGSFTYKNDLNLRIERADFDTYRPFNEPWATKHPDSSAKAEDYTVKYGASFVDKHTLVSVDGHRAILPMPKSPNSEYVSKDEMNFAKIVDIGGRVDEYLERSNLKVEDHE